MIIDFSADAYDIEAQILDRLAGLVVRAKGSDYERDVMLLGATWHQDDGRLGIRAKSFDEETADATGEAFDLFDCDEIYVY